MPMSKAGRKMMGSMKETYGPKKGEQVFYAMENKGKVPGMAYGGMAKKGYAKGGMVKSTGTLNTKIRKCKG